MFRCFHANKPSFLDHCMILHISHHVSRVFARQETAGFSEPCTHLSFIPLLSSISGTRLLSNQQIASKGCRRKLPTHLLRACMSLRKKVGQTEYYLDLTLKSIRW
ncbi:hypothetical protein HZ326_21954 [Fusarium oxysporum f. sp. albedinis]|nr:hypothetical protein HZ326_21954 [Fusarium oxysporum f. sp. albedinis]